jgi:Mg2+ and Co2+ transporter CorA
MWMVDPRILCRKHLLGEHLETHMFCGTIKKKCVSLDGYVENNLLEIESLKKRHDELAQEIINRNYHHNTPMEDLEESMVENIKQIKINKEASLKELLKRCLECNKRYMELVQKGGVDNDKKY